MAQPQRRAEKPQGILLLVTAADVINRDFGPRFADLPKQVAAKVIEEHLGVEVCKAAKYIVGLLPRLGKSHQTAATTPAGASGARPSPQTPLTPPQALGRSAAGSRDGVVHDTSGTPTAAASAAAAAAASAAAAAAAAAAPSGAGSGAGAGGGFAAAGEGVGRVQSSSHTAALLFAAIVVSNCGRAVPKLVRYLLQCGEEGADAPGGAPQGMGQGLRLEASAVRSLLDATGALCAASDLCQWHREVLRPLCDAVKGELEAYDLYRSVPSAVGMDGSYVDLQSPPYALRGLVLTAEQRAVVELVRQRCDEHIVTSVQAFAGTAKTTTARAIVASLRHLRILYLVYNKDMKEEAYQSMQRDLQEHGGTMNFKVQTTHSLAYSLVYNQNFNGRRLFDPSHATVRDFLVRLWRPANRKHVKAVVATAVRSAVARYMASEEDRLDGRHLALGPKKLDDVLKAMKTLLEKRGAPGDRQIAASGNLDAIISIVVGGAQALWNELVRPGSSIRDLPHNAYLKFCALQKPKLDRYDLILVDEAQDINGVTKQLILDLQAHTHIVLLGDRYQQIYSFNYACGLMSGRTTIPRPGPTLNLRQTFRFGPEIAAAVNAVLKGAFEGEKEFLIGREVQSPPDPPFHPGVVYCCLPYDRDLSSVTAEDLLVARLPTAEGPHRQQQRQQGPGDGQEQRREGLEEPQAEGPQAANRAFRFLQCPLRGLRPDEGFPLELDMTSPLPGAGVAVLPPELLPAARPRLTLVARRNVTLVQLALRLVAAGYAVCTSFQAAGEAKRAPILQRVVDVFEFMYRDKRFFESRYGSNPLFEVDTVEELQELVGAGADMELCNAYQLVEELRGSDPSLDVTALIDNLTQKMVRNPEDADYYLTTAHKMKGREHDVVQLAEDFVELSPTDDDGIRLLNRCRATSKGMDELHAVYVAASRARRVLLLNRDLSRLVLQLHQRQVRLVVPEREATTTAADCATAAAAGPSASPKAGEQQPQPQPHPQPQLRRTQQQPQPEPATPPRQVRPAFNAGAHTADGPSSAAAAAAGGEGRGPRRSAAEAVPGRTTADDDEGGEGEGAGSLDPRPAKAPRTEGSKGGPGRQRRRSPPPPPNPEGVRPTSQSTQTLSLTQTESASGDMNGTTADSEGSSGSSSGSSGSSSSSMGMNTEGAPGAGAAAAAAAAKPQPQPRCGFCNLVLATLPTAAAARSAAAAAFNGTGPGAGAGPGTGAGSAVGLGAGLQPGGGNNGGAALELPYVTWQGRRLCDWCAKGTVFGQVLDLAAGLAAGPAAAATAGAPAAAAPVDPAGSTPGGLCNAALQGGC